MNAPLKHIDLELYNDRVLSLDDALKKLLPGQRKILFPGAHEGTVLSADILTEINEILDEGVACARAGKVFDIGEIDQPDFVKEVESYNAGERRLPYKSCIVSRAVTNPVNKAPSGTKIFPTRWLYILHENNDRSIAIAVFATVAARPNNAISIGPIGLLKPLADDQYSFVFPPGTPEYFAENVFAEAAVSVLVCLRRLSEHSAALNPIIGQKIKPRHGKAFKVRYILVTQVRPSISHTQRAQRLATHASPIGHMRRGHWRSLKISGKSIWVREAPIKGGPGDQQVRSHYRIKG